MKRQWGIHACWLDKECRDLKCVPAHTYFFCYWFTIRINLPYTKYGIQRKDGHLVSGPQLDLDPRHVIQTWWQKEDKKEAENDRSSD